MAEIKRNRKRKGRRTFGSTRQLPSGRWQASYLAPDGTRRKADRTFAEAADANAWLSSIEATVSGGEWRPPEMSRERFVDYGDRWLLERVDLRPRTRELYEGLWRRWLKPSFQTMTIGAMTPETWRAWYLKATTDHPGSTQPAKAYRLARAMLNQAVDDGLLKSNPCRVKGAGKENAPERPVAMPDQVAAIAENMTDRYRLMVLLAAYCSLRFGELAGLRRARVDILHRTIRVEESAIELRDGSTIFGEPKTAAGRRLVAFPAELVPLIEAHLAEHVQAAPDALVFTSRDGLPLRRTKFRPFWADACKKLRSPVCTSTIYEAAERPGQPRPAPRCENSWAVWAMRHQRLPCATSTQLSSATRPSQTGSGRF